MGPRRHRVPPRQLVEGDGFRLLQHRGAADCVTSGAHLPCFLRATAQFVYVRLHGPDHAHLWASSYSVAGLAWWAARIAELATAGRGPGARPRRWRRHEERIRT